MRKTFTAIFAMLQDEEVESVQAVSFEADDLEDAYGRATTDSVRRSAPDEATLVVVAEGKPIIYHEDGIAGVDQVMDQE